MEAKKDNNKKAAKPAPAFDAEKAKAALKEATDEIVAAARELKKKFNEVDPATKKKIVAGVAATAAGIAALVGWHQMKKRK
jgi:hypothetical protein